MSMGRESYFWHKLHSLSGVIPVGFYMVQHLTLNSFSIAGPMYFDRVIGFFEEFPRHILLTMEVGLIWLPLFFHAIYGLMIVQRGLPNLSNENYRFRENKFYTFQRVSGMIAFAFLIYHVISTSILKMARGSTEHIQYFGMQKTFTDHGYLIFIVYLIGILCATYHFSYGIWGFCIRWGITVNPASQRRLWKFSQGAFVVLLILGWSALAGFLIHKPAVEEGTRVQLTHGVQTTAFGHSR